MFEEVFGNAFRRARARVCVRVRFVCLGPHKREGKMRQTWVCIEPKLKQCVGGEQRKNQEGASQTGPPPPLQNKGKREKKGKSNKKTHTLQAQLVGRIIDPLVRPTPAHKRPELPGGLAREVAVRERGDGVVLRGIPRVPRCAARTVDSNALEGCSHCAWAKHDPLLPNGCVCV